MDPQQLVDNGLALELLGETEEALNCYGQAMAAAPALPGPRYRLAVALSRLGRYRESLKAYRELMETAPRFTAAVNNLANLEFLLGRYQEAIRWYRHGLALQPGQREMHSNLLISMLYADGLSREELFAEHREWGRLYADALAPEPLPSFANEFHPRKRLRVGYVSADFYDAHPLPQFFEPMLRQHDERAVETYCYANVAQPDVLTKRLQGLAHHWRDIASISEAEFAAQVRRDRIDVLVDLAGHFRGNRLLAFATQPAPVQITYLGYPNTTGMRAMQYRFTDEWVDVPGDTDAFHTESLVRLPGGFLCFLPLEDAPEVGPLPLARNGHVTFGSFSYRPKITPEVIRLWSTILGRVPGSQLLLHRLGDIDNEEVQHELRTAFAEHGVAPTRIRFAPGLPRRDHLDLYNQVDLALDPFPYNGQTTTCEALSMGVPVVTLAGRTHVSRVGVGLLTVVGLPEFIAATEEAYAEIAVRAVADHARLAEIRAGLRQRLLQSNLGSVTSFTRNVEDAYRSLWERRCSAII